MLVVSCDVMLITIVQLIITLYFQFCIVFVELSFFSLVCKYTHFNMPGEQFRQIFSVLRRDEVFCSQSKISAKRG